MKLKVTQIRSTINRKGDQKRTIIALGLNRINRSRIHDDNPVIRGMINRVAHLVKVSEIEEEKPKKKAKKISKPKAKIAVSKKVDKKPEKKEDEKISKPEKVTEKLDKMETKPASPKVEKKKKVIEQEIEVPEQDTKEK
ncbi:MAG: 50S ribosomal protein L30 [Candidatus Cloacimonetes bacterium]|nr:50S ribosomal protein L30 [Candidatus Cloacimonadota bacterium]